MKKFPRIIRILIWPAGLILVLLVALIVILRVVLPANNITYQSLSYHFPSSLSISGLSIEKDGNLNLKSDTISLTWSWSSLLKGQPGLRNLLVKGLRGHVRGGESNGNKELNIPRFRVSDFRAENISFLYISESDSFDFVLNRLYLDSMESADLLSVDSLFLTGVEAKILSSNKPPSEDDSTVFSLKGIPSFELNSLVLQNSSFLSRSDSSRQSVKDLDLSLSSWKSEDLFSLKINRLDFIYQDSLEMNLVMEDGSLNREFETDLSDISIGLPGTLIAIAQINASFKDEVRAELTLARSYFSLGTLREFVPAVNEYLNPGLPDQEKVFLSADIAYLGDSIRIRILEVETPGNIQAELEGYLRMGSDSLQVFAEHLGLQANDEGLKTLLREQDYNQFFLWPDNLELKARVRFLQNDLFAKGILETSSGDINLNMELQSQDEYSSFKLSAGSDALKVNELTDISPVEITGTALWYEMNLITPADSGNSDMKIKAVAKGMIVEGSKIDSIDFEMNTLAGEQKMVAVVRDDSLSLNADVVLSEGPSAWSDFHIDLGSLYPSVFVEGLNPGKWSSEISGKFLSGEDHFRLKTQISDTRLEADRLNPVLPILNLELSLADTQFEATLSSEGGEMLYASGGTKFTEFQLPVAEWIADLPEMTIRANTGVNSEVLTWLTGTSTGMELKAFTLKKSKQQIDLSAEVGKVWYGELKAEDLNMGVEGNRNTLKGELTLARLDHPEFEMKNFQTDLDLSSSFINTDISFEFTDTLGVFSIPLLTELQDEGYLFRFQPEKELIIADGNWVISRNEGLMVSDSLTLVRGDLAIHQGGTELSLNTRGDDIYVKATDLNAAPVISWFLKTENAEALLDAEIELNTASRNMEFSVSSDAISAGAIPQLALELKGRLSDDNLKADARVYNQDLSVDAGVSKEGEDIEYQLELTDFNLMILKELPFWPSDGEIAGRVTGQMEGILGEQIRNQGFLLIENGRINLPTLPSELFVEKDSLFFDGSRLEFRNFEVLDTEGHSLRVEGGLDYYPEPEFSLSIKSDRFRLISKDDPEPIGGEMIVKADLRLEGSLDDLMVSGDMGTLEGGELVYLTESGFNMVDPSQIVTFMRLDGADSLSKVSGNGTNSLIDWDVTFNLANTDVEVILDPISQENLRVSASGELNLRRGSNRIPRVFGTISSGSGSAYLELPAIPDLNLTVEQAEIRWNGPLDDPSINFRGYETVRTSPAGLAVQFSERKDVIPFRVIVRLEDASLSELDVGFDLEGGDAPTRDYISSLPLDTRQSYAINLLVFRRFGDSDNPENSLLIDKVTSKLNEISRRNLKNTDLTFSANTYEDERSAPGETRTDINYTFSREFLNSRLSFSVGGHIGLESEEFDEPTPDQLMGNIEVKYRISNTPPLVIKGKHEEVYEGVIDGDIRKTSVGVSFQKTWKRFSDIFNKKDRRQKNE